jgi:molybdenum cofactor cytidylyltransferase
MASSIRKGVEELATADSSLEGVLIMACDQPHLSSGHLVSLVEHAAASNQLIAASRYGETLGIPAFFRKGILPRLCSLQGDSGAKKLMLENEEQVAVVDFAAGDIDIDTEADYEMLLHKIEG